MSPCSVHIRLDGSERQPIRAGACTACTVRSDRTNLAAVVGPGRSRTERWPNGDDGRGIDDCDERDCPDLAAALVVVGLGFVWADVGASVACPVAFGDTTPPPTGARLVAGDRTDQAGDHTVMDGGTS